MGILQPIPCANVFPPVDNASTRTPESVQSELAGWSNYRSAEDEPGIVDKLLQEQAAKGHCKFFETYEELLDYLGVDDVVLSKLALISKDRPDGTTKHRLIWDLLRSDVNAATSLFERIILPRLQDAVEDAQHLLRTGSEIEWMVLDIADAFHNVPLHPSERKYVCTKVGDRFVVFKVMCMGGKASPNVWGRFAAAIGRILASLFDPSELRCEIYVDDPLVAVTGSKRQRTRLFTIAALALAVLGFPMAWSKAVVGCDVTWKESHRTCVRVRSSRGCDVT